MKRAKKGLNLLFLKSFSSLFPGLAKSVKKGTSQETTRSRNVRFLALGFCALALSLILFARTRSSPQNDNSFRAQTQAQLSQPLALLLPEKTNVGPTNPACSGQACLLRLDLIENSTSEKAEALEDTAKAERDIFRSAAAPELIIPEKVEPQKNKTEPEPPVLINPEIAIKLQGIIEKQIGSAQNELERYAVLSVEEEILVVKKGDVISGRYEVTQIGEDEAEILDKETRVVVKLVIN